MNLGELTEMQVWALKLGRDHGVQMVWRENCQRKKKELSQFALWYGVMWTSRIISNSLSSAQIQSIVRYLFHRKESFITLIQNHEATRMVKPQSLPLSSIKQISCNTHKFGRDAMNNIVWISADISVSKPPTTLVACIWTRTIAVRVTSAITTGRSCFSTQ